MITNVIHGWQQPVSCSPDHTNTFFFSTRSVTTMKMTVIHVGYAGVLLLVLFFSLYTVQAEYRTTIPEKISNLAEIDNGRIVVDPDSLFDIYFVSYEKLQRILSQPGSHTGVLKTDPGIMIGIITPTVLYIRSDLHSGFLPVYLNDSITMDDISLHLIDIVFGKDNQKVSVFQSDIDYKFFFTDEYHEEDIRSVLEFARLFNDISGIVTIEDEECERSFLPGSYRIIPYYYYNITIISPVRFSEYLDDKDPTEVVLRSLRGKAIGIVRHDGLILTDDLSRDERNYYLLRGILWSMGFHGESTRYLDSFFSKGKMNQNFSEIDLQAISLLYGGRLNDGMDLEGVKMALNLIENRKYQVIG